MQPDDNLDFGLTLRDDLPSLARAQESLRDWLALQPLSPAARNRVEVVFEELATNVILHGHPGGQRGEHSIHASLRLRPQAVELTMQDDGLAFDPRGRAGQPLSGPLEEAQIGGLGLLLVQRMTSGVDYMRTPEGWNRIKVDVRLA